MKKDYLSIIENYINHMSKDQLIDLHDLYLSLFINSGKVKIPIPYGPYPICYLYGSYNEFVYNKIKYYTYESQYINIINLIHLICIKY